jgi:hypothetical protein
VQTTWQPKQLSSRSSQTEAAVQQQQQQQQPEDQWEQPADCQDDMQEEQLQGDDAAGGARSVVQLGGPQHTDSDAGDVGDYRHAVQQQQQQCGDYSGFPVDEVERMAQQM